MKGILLLFYFLIMSVHAYTAEPDTKHREIVSAEVEVFPNPTEDFITIKVNKVTDHSITLKIYSIIGNTVHSSNINKEKTIIDFRAFSPGYYWISLKEPYSGFSKTIKILKI